MLKAVSSITNAIGALNYKGTWNASTNTPALTSGAGTKGDYYVVSVAGTTSLDGISNWGIGDWAVFNGSVWQRVEGGADLNGVNLSVSGTTTLSGLTASTALALDGSKNIVSVTNTGTGNNVLADSPTLVGNVTLSTGNLVVADTKGIDFSATPGTGTSELLDDYEEGTFNPTISSGITGVGYATQNGSYTKIGRLVTFSLRLELNAGTAAATILRIGGLPFASDIAFRGYAGSWGYAAGNVVGSTTTNLPTINIDTGASSMAFYDTAGSAFNGTSLVAASSLSVDLAGWYYTT